MNQILCTNKISISNVDIGSRKRTILKIFFYSTIFIAVLFSIYYIYIRYDINKSEQISKNLLENFNITSIYRNKSNYSSAYVNQEIYFDAKNDLSSFVVGVIEIKHINIMYPILSELNKDFLKISPCKFYGPLPNETGNMCIAAHNYKNNSFFSNLSKLGNGDIVTIYDTKGNHIDYIVYNLYTSISTDTSCIEQPLSNQKIITLVTCDSMDNNYRTIVKAKAI